MGYKWVRNFFYPLASVYVVQRADIGSKLSGLSHFLLFSYPVSRKGNCRQLSSVLIHGQTSMPKSTYDPEALNIQCGYLLQLNWSLFGLQ
jgi:hypothetical protein